ncbi:MAG: hypothetical protein KKA07_18090, partial [Bacteroidetes bacterium]|nr:hypothetical protein [Bacteroidota bacterium]
GNQFEVYSERFAGMHNQHIGAQKYSVKSLNYSGKILIRAGVDGNLINAGVERYKSLNQKHLKSVSASCRDGILCVVNRTVQSEIEIATLARVTAKSDRGKHEQSNVIVEGASVFVEFAAEIACNETFSAEKIIAITDDRGLKPDEVIQKALNIISNSGSFAEEYGRSVKSWESLWEKADIRIYGDRFTQKMLRLHIYHLMVSASEHNVHIDAGLTARGLHGEAYRGHVFWDELYILPWYYIHLPETAKSLLMYRYRRLNAAKEYAKEHGYSGAMFPWQSGSDGREETQIIHLNPLTGEWGADHSSLQRHVSLAIAYNTWQYYHYTGDVEFLNMYGAEMMLEIGRFWASKSKLDEKSGRYHIGSVMGPDEFHEQYHDSAEGGITDNAYTNIMVAWLFRKINELNGNPEIDVEKVFNKTGITRNEIEDWIVISRKLNLDISKEGIIAQYAGYFDLEELDWDYYRAKYGNIYRMDRILKAERKSPDQYKVSKQADTLMVFYNLPLEEVSLLINQMGYCLPDDYLQRNLEYYLKRTSHGSTLSRVVHAQLAALAGEKKMSWELFQDAVGSDFNDIQGGTTGEGIHAGVMAGTLVIALKTYAGLDLSGEVPVLSPDIPAHWTGMSFGFLFRDAKFLVNISGRDLKIEMTGIPETNILVSGQSFNMKNHQKHTMTLK